MNNTVLKIENLCKKISNEFSLTDINLELKKGEVHALFGENGSGKSSLLQILAGIITQDSGNIFLEDNLITMHSPNNAKKLGISVIYQEPTLFDHFSIAENVFVSNKPYSNSLLKLINQEKIYVDCQMLLDKLNIPLNCKALTRGLGIAQKQMIEIVKSYISNPKVILMDEPTSFLTEAEVNILFSIIEKLKSNGSTILYISHRIDELIKISDRISIIREGRIVETKYKSNTDLESIIHTATGMEHRAGYPKLKVKLGVEVLKVSNLHISPYLSNINFSIRKGEIIGITGLAGSGGSKIARCIFGLDRMDSGDIHVDQYKKIIRSPLDAIRAGIGYVTENRSIEGLFNQKKIYENVSAANLKLHLNSSTLNFLRLLNLPYEKEVTKKFMRKLQIKNSTYNQKVNTLSEGNQQKVLLAKWMQTRSKILILHEPTKGVDVVSKVDIYNSMNELIQKGTSIILISSDIDELLGMCDRIFVLYGGTFTKILSSKEATKEKVMYYASGGK